MPDAVLFLGRHDPDSLPDTLPPFLPSSCAKELTKRNQSILIQVVQAGQGMCNSVTY